MLMRRWRKRNIPTLLVGYKLVQSLWKSAWSSLKQLKVELPHNPMITQFLGIYTKECAPGYNRATCTHVYCSTIYMVNPWKQHQCPTTDEQIKKMWHIYTMEFYSATKNEITLSVGKWMELENFMLNEVRQAQKTKNCMFSFI
jgi:hypothetical protein